MSKKKESQVLISSRPQMVIPEKLPLEEGIDLSTQDVCTRLVLQVLGERLLKKISLEGTEEELHDIFEE